MQISSFETTQGLERRLSVDIAAEEIDSKVQKRLTEISKTAKIDGFRPGKIPLAMVTKRFKPSVRAEIVGEAIQDGLREAFKQKEVKPVGRPKIEAINDKDGEPLSFTAVFEIYPSVELPNVSEIQVENPVIEISQADIDKVIDSWRKMRATFNEVERASQSEDQITIDYTCILNGEKVEEGSGKEVVIRLGQQELLPGFEEGVLNLKAGEEKTVEITFPENHPTTKLAGQTVQLQVAMKKVEEPVLPEVNEEFIKSFGVQEATLEKLHANIKENLQKRSDDMVKSVLKESIFQQLLEKVVVEVPQTMIEGEMEMIRQRIQGETHHVHDEHCHHNHEAEDQEIRQQAIDSVKLGLIVGQFVNDEGITYDQQRVFNAVKDIAVRYQDPQEVAKNIMKNDGMMQRLIASVLEEQAVEKLIERVQKQDTSKTYEEIVNLLQGE